MARAEAIGCDRDGHPQNYAHDCEGWERGMEYVRTLRPAPSGSSHSDEQPSSSVGEVGPETDPMTNKENPKDA